MSLEIRGGEEAFATLRALMRSLVQVGALMLLQLVLCGESSHAVEANERPFIRVYVLYMCNEIVLCFKVPVTMTAVVGPFFGVSELVSHKTRLPVETLVTQRAREGFFACVNGQMEFESLGIGKRSAALLAFVRLLSGVIILVTLQYSLISETLVTLGAGVWHLSLETEQNRYQNKQIPTMLL